MTQIIIVGAGPTGATLALLLAQRGIAVTLVEAARSFRRLFRGEALMPSGLAAFNANGTCGFGGPGAPSVAGGLGGLGGGTIAVPRQRTVGTRVANPVRWSPNRRY